MMHDDSGQVIKKDYTLEEQNDTAYGYIPGIRTGKWSVTFILYSGHEELARTESSVEVQTDSTSKADVRIRYETDEYIFDFSWDTSGQIDPSVEIYSMNTTLVCIKDISWDPDEFMNSVVCFGDGDFTNLKSISFIFPDGEEYFLGARTNNNLIYQDDTGFRIKRSGYTANGTYRAVITDINDAVINKSNSIFIDSVENHIPEIFGDAFNGTVSESSSDITWSMVSSEGIGSIVVFISDTNDFNTYLYRELLSGTAAAIPAGTISAGIINGFDCQILVMAFDKTISNISEFDSISDFKSTAIIEEILNNVGIDFDYIGYMRSTFTGAL